MNVTETPNYAQRSLDSLEAGKTDLQNNLALKVSRCRRLPTRSATPAEVRQHAQRAT